MTTRTVIVLALVFLFAFGVAATPRIVALEIAGDVSEALKAAQLQFSAGDYSAAITTLQSVVQQNPSSAEALFWLGRSYYELHDYNNAVAQLEKSTQLDGKNSEYHHQLGIAYGARADRERSFSLAKKVKKEFQTAVQLNPSNIRARRDLMEFCVNAPWIVGGSKDEARTQIEAIEKLDPIEGHLAWGTFYIVGKRQDQAEKEYRKVLAAKPKRIEVYFEVADFYIGQNKAQEVQATNDAASQTAPDDPRLAYYRGVQQVLSGTDLARGEEHLKAYLKSTPDRSTGLHTRQRRIGWGGSTKRKESGQKRRITIEPLCNWIRHSRTPRLVWNNWKRSRNDVAPSLVFQGDGGPTQRSPRSYRCKKALPHVIRDSDTLNARDVQSVSLAQISHICEVLPGRTNQRIRGLS